MINMKGIEKYYASGALRTYVLRQIDLEIREGDFLTIMGPSGAGKSTLLHIMGMLDEPSGGEYSFLDQPVIQLKEKDRTELHKRHIGFVFQAYHLIDELTVYEKMEMPLLYQKVKGSERQGRVCELLDRWIDREKQSATQPPLDRRRPRIVDIGEVRAACAAE